MDDFDKDPHDDRIEGGIDLDSTVVGADLQSQRENFTKEATTIEQSYDWTTKGDQSNENISSIVGLTMMFAAFHLLIQINETKLLILTSLLPAALASKRLVLASEVVGGLHSLISPGYRGDNYSRKNYQRQLTAGNQDVRV